MTKIKDGGPAFPRMPNPLNIEGERGMSLRDYFAGQALMGLLSGNDDYTNVPVGEGVHNHVAKNCYAFADAMLKAREEGRG